MNALDRRAGAAGEIKQISETSWIGPSIGGCLASFTVRFTDRDAPFRMADFEIGLSETEFDLGNQFLGDIDIIEREISPKGITLWVDALLLDAE